MPMRTSFTSPFATLMCPRAVAATVLGRSNTNRAGESSVVSLGVIGPRAVNSTLYPSPVRVTLTFSSAERPVAAAPVTGAAATGRSALEKVNVTRTGDGYNVELTARGPITPKLTTLDSPARLVLDLPNTVAATARGHISVANGDVKDVRIGMDGQNPPTTRVVVDLIHACQYEIGSADGNRIVLKLHDGNGAVQTASKAAPANAVPVAPAKVMAAATAPVSSEPTT